MTSTTHLQSAVESETLRDTQSTNTTWTVCPLMQVVIDCGDCYVSIISLVSALSHLWLWTLTLRPVGGGSSSVSHLGQLVPLCGHRFTLHSTCSCLLCNTLSLSPSDLFLDIAATLFFKLYHDWMSEDQVLHTMLNRPDSSEELYSLYKVLSIH